MSYTTKKDMMSAWVGLNIRLRTQGFPYTIIGIILPATVLFTYGFLGSHEPCKVWFSLHETHFAA